MENLHLLKHAISNFICRCWNRTAVYNCALAFVGDNTELSREIHDAFQRLSGSGRTR